MGVAHGVQGVRGQDEQRVGAPDLAQDVGQLLLQRSGGRAREQVKDHLRVGAGLEDGAVALHLPPQRLRVGQVAVVGDGDRAAGRGGGDGLGVSQIGAACRRVADVADGAMAGQAAQSLRAEHVGHPSHGLLGVEVHAVRGRDPRGFLPPVLEGVEPEIGHVGRLGMVPDPEQPALVVELVVTFLAGVVVTPHSAQSRSSTRLPGDRDPRQRPSSRRAPLPARPPRLADPAPGNRPLPHQRLEGAFPARLDFHQDPRRALAEERQVDSAPGRSAPPGTRRARDRRCGSRPGRRRALPPSSRDRRPPGRPAMAARAAAWMRRFQRKVQRGQFTADNAMSKPEVLASPEAHCMRSEQREAPTVSRRTTGSRGAPPPPGARPLR